MKVSYCMKTGHVRLPVLLEPDPPPQSRPNRLTVAYTSSILRSHTVNDYPCSKIYVLSNVATTRLLPPSTLLILVTRVVVSMPPSPHPPAYCAKAGHTWGGSRLVDDTFCCRNSGANWGQHHHCLLLLLLFSTLFSLLPIFPGSHVLFCQRFVSRAWADLNQSTAKEAKEGGRE